MEQIVTDNYVAPYLPEETIRNILVRLPVKSLMRFRCVCRDWKDLFKTETFIAEHLDHSTTKQRYLISYFPRGESDLCLINLVDDDMKFDKFLEQPIVDVPVNTGKFVCSSNGLLCVKLRSSGSIFLWNPAIKEFHQVLITVNPFQEEYYKLGFGFSPILNDYKIVRITFSRYDNRVHRVEVYSLSKGSWKEVDSGNLNGVSRINNDNVTCNGSIFWFCLMNHAEGESGDGDACFIVSFNIAREVFTLIKIPTSNRRSARFKMLTVYENKLAMLSERGHEDSDSSSIDLWVMEGLSWTKLYTITIPFPKTLPPMVICQDKILCAAISDDWSSKIILVNLMTNEFKMSSMIKLFFDDMVFNYVESLVPISGNTGSVWENGREVLLRKPRQIRGGDYLVLRKNTIEHAFRLLKSFAKRSLVCLATFFPTHKCGAQYQK